MPPNLDKLCDTRLRPLSQPSGTVTGVKALEFSRKEARYVAAALSSRLRPGSGAATGPLSMVETDPVDLPGPGWHRVQTRLAGICGSDLATVDGRSARYFEPWVSFPFVPGHEVVGLLEDGSRVVLEPVLGHEARGFAPPFPGAAPGDGDDYRHLVSGHLEPGIQTGYCASTGAAGPRDWWPTSPNSIQCPTSCPTRRR